jgi:hypothetical protein
MEDLGRGLSGYVVQMTRTIVGQGLRLDILQRLVTAFVLFGPDGGGGPGPSDEKMGLREGLDQGVSLPPVPPLSLSIPHGWIPQPSTPPPRSVGPTRSSRSSRMRPTGSGQRCRPSRVQRLRMSAIADFVEIEEAHGTWEAMQQLGEELEMHRIEVNHDVLGCQNCNLLSSPLQYCKRSRYHVDHPLHQCPLSQYCGCLDN